MPRLVGRVQPTISSRRRGPCTTSNSSLAAVGPRVGGRQIPGVTEDIDAAASCPLAASLLRRRRLVRRTHAAALLGQMLGHIKMSGLIIT